jgi:hypothetical protein
MSAGYRSRSDDKLQVCSLSKIKFDKTKYRVHIVDFTVTQGNIVINAG